jgi:hypothetical protein
MSLEWARQFPEDVAVMEAFYAEKEEAKFAIKAAKQAARKEREEKAARRAEEKKNGAGPSTIVIDSSLSFEWTSTTVSSTTPGSSDIDWDSE